MTPESLAKHLTDLGFVHDTKVRSGVDLTAAGNATGVTRDTLRRYLTGKPPVPLTLCLAIAALKAGLTAAE